MYDSLAHGNEPITIAIALHVVRRSDGSGGIAPAQLDQAMIDATDAFVPMGIDFCIKGDINYIDSDTYYYDMNGIDDINALRSEAVSPGAINIYFTPNLVYNGNQICGISSFSYSPVQGIVMHNNCTGVSHNPSTFPHEIGHYFDLFHTYETAFGQECPDGSNCSIAGDLICDTPADPLMNLGDITPECRWTGTTPPPCGIEPYDPDPTNFMSFSRTTCRDSFTPQQADRAIATIINFRPELLDATCDGLPGDLNGDGVVSVSDLLILLAAWGPCPPGGNCPADLNSNGLVDVSDLLILLANWG